MAKIPDSKFLSPTKKLRMGGNPPLVKGGNGAPMVPGMKKGGAVKKGAKKGKK